MADEKSNNTVSSMGVEDSPLNTDNEIQKDSQTGLDMQQVKEVNEGVNLQENKDKQPAANENINQENHEDASQKNKKADRRVKFPDDVIHGYHEPPVPWNDVTTKFHVIQTSKLLLLKDKAVFIDRVSHCTTEELVSAYKKSCVKHDVKPLPKLLQQLNAITNFHDRNETLTVRGENLNVRHSETLEEILRRVQFRTIDLEASHLDEESAIAIFDMVEFYQSALRVNISYNKIGLRGWQACSKMLKKTPCVQHLDARCCSITEQVLPIFGRALRLGSMLKILHLENSIMSGRSLMILVAAIKMNEYIEEVFLADNKLMPSDGIQLGNLLKFNHKIKLLDVRNNHLGDVGTTHISDGLFEQSMGKGLETLVLWNNQITYQCMVSLGRALKATKNLETINLGHNNITNEGIHRLKDGLMHNKSLLRIGLQAAKVCCEGAVALAECIAESMFLVRLDLRENEIKTGGLMALALALKVNHSVNRIDIDQHPKKESSIKDYADQQRRMLQDINNYSQRNRDLGLKKEEEERQKKLEEEMQAALKECEEATEEKDLKLPHPLADVKDVVVSQVNPVEEKQINEETVNVKEASNDGNSEQSLFEDSGKEAEPEKEVESHQLRLQLHLPIPSRSQSLDSPVETQEIVYPPLNIPETVSENDAVSSVREESPLPPEFPPSPMVSHGKTIYSAMSSQGTGIPLLDSEFSLEENEKEPVMSLLRSVSKEQPSTSSMGDNSKSDNNNSGKLTPPVSQSPKRSPTSRRKFTISRVEEPGVVHSNSPSPTQVVVLGDPLGAISGVDINTLSIKPQAKHNLSSDSTNSDNIREVNQTVNDNVVKELQQNITDEITDAIVSVNLNLKSPVLVEYTEASSTNRNISDSNCEVENTGIKDDVHISNNDASCLKTEDPVLATSQSKGESYIESSSLNEPYVIFPTHESNNTKMTDSKNNEITNNSKDNSSAIEKSCDQLKQSDVDHRSGVGEHSRSSLVEMGASASGSVSCNDSANIVSLNGVTIDVNDLLEGADVPDMQIGEGDSASSSLDLLSSADDFEKELDSMLANVQSGSQYAQDAVQSESSS